jgi:hypothetical protein
MSSKSAQRRAQARYNTKTKTVSFRVSNEQYDELEAIKDEANLSYADLMKLGAGLCQDEMQRKLENIGGLRDEIARLDKQIAERDKEIKRGIDEKRKAAEGSLERELDARYSTLFEIEEQIEEREQELKRIEAERKSKEAMLNEITNKLLEFQRKHSEAQLTNYMMTIAAMAMLGNVAQSLQPSPGKVQGQLVGSTPNLVDLVSVVFPVFMMSGMMNAMNPPKKRLVPNQPESNALSDFMKRLKRTQLKLQTPEAEDISQEEGEFEAEDEND